MISTSQAILRDTYGIKEQGKAQGVFALGVIVGPALGPVIGGWITDNWNWHWIFFINIPVGIIAATLIWNFLRNPAEPQYRRLDWIGLILMCVGLGSMQFVLENGQQYDWFDDARIRWFTFLSVTGLFAFVWWTLRSAIPIVDLRVLRLRQVAAGTNGCGADPLEVDEPSVDEDAELVAAEPVGRSAARDAPAQPVAEPVEQRVAGAVAERVVVGLEAVEVEQQEEPPGGVPARRTAHRAAASARAGCRGPSAGR